MTGQGDKMTEQDKFNESVINNDIVSVRSLLNDQRVNPADYYNRAIRLASSEGHVNVVKLLLTDPRVDPSDMNNNAIIFSSKKGYINIVKLLLTDPRVDPSADHNYAIRQAFIYNHSNVVEILWGLKIVKNSLKNDAAELYQKLIAEDVINKVKSF